MCGQRARGVGVGRMRQGWWVYAAMVAACGGRVEGAYVSGNVVDLHGSLQFSIARGVFGSQQVGDAFSAGFANEHAFLWTASPGASTDLHPAGFNGSIGYGVYAGRQVGYLTGPFPSVGTQTHATLWSGTNANLVDLHPAGGFDTSFAQGIFRNQQVGYASGPNSSGNNYAFLWNGSGNTAVGLNPTGYTRSIAYGTNGMQQAGYAAGAATGNANHAFLWNGAANAFVDLHGTAFSTTQALAIAEGQQAGFGIPVANNQAHALVWSGTKESLVDLNPAGYSTSRATGTNGQYQVGYGNGTATGFADHALLWTGTAGSAVWDPLESTCRHASLSIL